jgi:Domain of unknown function (DUF4260)
VWSEGDSPSDGGMSGLPRLLLRLEGAVLLALAVFFYARYSASWWLFAVLLPAPDVGMLGYLAKPQVGAVAYNVFHTICSHRPWWWSALSPAVRRCLQSGSSGSRTSAWIMPWDTD